MTTKSKLKYGNKDLLPKDFLEKKVKVRITTFIDEDILLKLKAYAKENGLKYQSVLNSLLRSFFQDKPSQAKISNLSEEKIRRIVRDELKKRA